MHMVQPPSPYTHTSVPEADTFFNVSKHFPRVEGRDECARARVCVRVCLGVCVSARVAGKRAEAFVIG